MRFFRRTVVSVCLAFFALPFYAVSTARNAKTVVYYLNPHSIVGEVTSRGADEVVGELVHSVEAWTFIMTNVASGADDWLQVAVALGPGTDGYATESMGLALGEALKSAPEKVLRLFSDQLWLTLICSYPDVHDSRYATKDKTLKEIERRKQNILAIKNPKLTSLCERCIKNLEKAKQDISEWFDAQQ